MRAILFVIIFLVNIITAFGQELIKEANVSIQLPNNKWELKDKQERNGMFIYSFKREALKDTLGRDIIPNISVIVEDINKNLDVVTYSIMKRSQVSFQVDDMFIHEDGILDFKNAIGFKGRYTDRFGEHTVYVIHAINKKKGLQIFCDVLTGLFDQLDPEFKIALKSLKKNK